VICEGGNEKSSRTRFFLAVHGYPLYLAVNDKEKPSVPYHSLLNNDDSGDVEVFEAMNAMCCGCGAERVMRRSDDPQDELDERHQMDCDEDEFESVDLDWYYAFGSEGYNWNDSEATGPYDTEGSALAGATRRLIEEINEKHSNPPNTEEVDDGTE
jgi:hypothetical protein